MSDGALQRFGSFYIHPLTADFTTIDLTDLFPDGFGGGNDGLEAHHISFSDSDVV